MFSTRSIKEGEYLFLFFGYTPDAKFVTMLTLLRSTREPACSPNMTRNGRAPGEASSGGGKHCRGCEEQDRTHDVVLEIEFNPRTDLWEILVHDLCDCDVSVLSGNHDLSKMTALARLMSDTQGLAYGGVRYKASGTKATVPPMTPPDRGLVRRGRSAPRSPGAASRPGAARY